MDLVANLECRARQLRQRWALLQVPHGPATQIPRILRKLDNVVWEYRLGVSTSGIHGKEERSPQGEYHYYATMPYRAIFRILSFLSLKDRDTFVDLGCGKGRALFCAAASYDLAEVIGVEYSVDLCKLARHNAQQLRPRRAPVSIICGSAEEFDFTRGTVFYLFNPFGPNIMRAMLARLGAGLKAREREIRIVYVNPVHEEVLASTPWLRRYATLPDAILHEFKPTSFWISTAGI